MLKKQYLFLIGIVLISLSVSSVCAENTDNQSIQVIDDIFIYKLYNWSK